MAIKMSIWTTDGRKDKFKREVSASKIESLKAKRIRQLTNLIKKYSGNVKYIKRVKRWEVKLVSLSL